MPRLPRLARTLACCLALGTHAAAATYYVAPSGDDAFGDGSAGAPWRTIQKAANTALAGDTVFIRGGTYRERVVFARDGTEAAPIVFQNHPGESVTVTGLDELVPGTAGIGNWTQHDATLWKITLDAAHSLGAGRNQVALGGTLLREARWPNSARYDDVARTDMRSAEAGAIDLGSATGLGHYLCTYTDAGLAAFAAGAWNGATLRAAVGKGWVPATGTVTAQSGSTLTFRYRYTGNGDDDPSAGDPFFLFGRLVALDAEGEFFLDDTGQDGAARTLYVVSPAGSPAGSTLEVRARDIALDLSNRSHVTLTGLRVLAARLVLNAATHHCTLDRLAVDYAGHNYALSTGAAGDSVNLDGTANTLRHSAVRHATQHGVALAATATDCVVENSVVSDCGWAGLNLGGSTRPTVQDCTVHDTGSFGLQYNATSGRLLRNHVYFAGTYCTDIGLINAFATGDAQGTEIAYNWAHDNLAPYDLTTRDWNGGCGIRLDCGFAAIASLNVVVHHNVVWNTTHPGSVVFWGVTDAQWAATTRSYDQASSTINTRDFAYHNTLDHDIHYGSGRTGGVPIYASGGRLLNNLVAGTLDLDRVNTTSVEARNNLLGTAAASFPDNTTQAHGFSPPYSDAFSVPAAARDTGVALSGINDSFTGTAPDLGAYEAGGPHWLAGASVLPEHVAGLGAGVTGSGAATRVTLSGFAAGRALPTAAVLRLGTVSSTATTLALDAATHTFTASFTVDASNLGGAQTVALALDGTTFTALTQSVTLPLLAQAITFAGPADQPFTLDAIPLTASSSAGLTVGFSILSGPARLDGAALTATGPGSIVVRASQAGDAAHAAAADVDRTFTLTTSFAAWRATYFNADELADPAISGPTAATGADGVPNLVKYALGLPATLTNSSGLPTSGATATDWTLDFTHPADRPDLTYAVERSTDLTAWTTDTVTLQRLSTDGTTETWRATTPAGGTPILFFRLRVTAP